MLQGEQEDGLTFKNMRGNLSDQMGLKIETKKGNNEQDKNKTDAEEASRLLLEKFFLGSSHNEEYTGN